MYKIVGVDQKEYGPVSAEEVRLWINEGRANRQTIARFEDGPWKPLATFTEFAVDLPPAPSGASESLGGSAPPPFMAGALPTGGRQTNTLAVAGLVLGVLSVTCGLLCCGPLFQVPGLIVSGLGLSQINQNPERYSTQRGVAIGGIALSTLGLLYWASLFFLGLTHGLWRAFPRF